MVTPSMPRSLLTISSACAVELAATVTSMRSFSWPEAVTSRPVTEPPEDSTAVVSRPTAVPLAGTSSRTVIEYETLGAVAMTTFFRFLREGGPWWGDGIWGYGWVRHTHAGACSQCGSIVAPTAGYSVNPTVAVESYFHDAGAG